MDQGCTFVVASFCIVIFVGIVDKIMHSSVSRSAWNTNNYIVQSPEIFPVSYKTGKFSGDWHLKTYSGFFSYFSYFFPEFPQLNIQISF